MAGLGIGDRRAIGLRPAPQALALLLGAYVLLSWISGVSLGGRVAALAGLDRMLGFLGLPLLLYGLATLLASRRERIQRVMEPVLLPIGGVLGRLALQHAARKPHRAMAFLLIVALMASVSLYPIVAIGSFEDRARRGARAQIGMDWQLFYNAPDLVRGEGTAAGAEAQLALLRPKVAGLLESLGRVPGVVATAHLVETVLPSFFLPGYGLRGVPLYLLDANVPQNRPEDRDITKHLYGGDSELRISAAIRCDCSGLAWSESALAMVRVKNSQSSSAMVRIVCIARAVGIFS